MSNQSFDVAVLGGGPGGYIAAIRCAQYGLKAALIEARELGGTCLNRGCIPTKALLASAHAYQSALHADSFGVTVQNVGYDYAKFAARKDGIVKRLRSGVEGLEKAHGVTVIRGYGKLMDAHTLQAGDACITARDIILATGSSPALPPIPGINAESIAANAASTTNSAGSIAAAATTNIVTSDEVLGFTRLPESFVIIGGGVIGIEFASLFSALGKPVAVLEMLPSILPGVDGDIVKRLVASLSAKGVNIVTRAKVLSLSGEKTVAVEYELDGARKTASAECCVVCVGRKPQTAGIGLDKAGVVLDRGFVRVDDHMRTNMPNIYAVGDITGKAQLAHVASAQALAAAANCAGRPQAFSYGIIPACIYTEPEIAFVGMSAEQAAASGKRARTASFDLAANGKAMTMGESGLVKLAYDDATGEILGAQIFAPRATDMIAEVAAVMRAEGVIEELADTIHPHPTLSEAIYEAAHAAEGLCCHAAPVQTPAAAPAPVPAAAPAAAPAATPDAAPAQRQ